MKPEDIRLEDIWAAELSILDAIHQICEQNGLRYSLAYGTLLGAVRHKGFIPWDDDVDIMMPREDYDKLIALWNSCAPKGYVLDQCEVQEDSVNNFSKIRKDHTTFIQSEEDLHRKHHQGIFVDIFPGDRAATGKISSKVQLLDFALNLLFCRGYTSGAGGFTGFVEHFLLKIVPRRSYRKISLFYGKRSRRWNGKHDNPFVFPATIQDSRLLFPADLFENIEKRVFMGKQYLAVRDADQALRIQYGDYMQLPPENERVWKHHPILIDFTHNYDELLQSTAHTTAAD